MDLNEIAMNLVPFPQLHYLVSSLTPLYMLADVNVPTRRYFIFKNFVVKVTRYLMFTPSKSNLHENTTLVAYVRLNFYLSLDLCKTLSAFIKFPP